MLPASFSTVSSDESENTIATVHAMFHHTEDNQAASELDDAVPVDSTPESDPADAYALQFLTYAYTVPFRLIAVQQELADVFGFSGSFDDEFTARWDSLSRPEQAAFSQSYREYRRMQALSRAFSSADHSKDVDITAQERAGRFIAAHIDGLEQWQQILRAEAASVGSRAVSEASRLDNVPVPLPAHIIGEGPPTGSEDRFGRQFFLGDLDRQDGTDIAAITQQFAPIDELAEGVIEKLISAEQAEARRRFFIRVRWILGLPNQQRMAVALRTTGRKRREIARAMGISEESVKTHLSRADDDWSQRQAETTPPRGKNASPKSGGTTAASKSGG